MRESIIRCSLLSIGILAMLLTAGAAAGRRDKVTLCHVPPGNPGNAHEIVVGEPAVKHHLRNHPGDSVGSCPAACNPDDCDDGNACTVDVCNADGTCDSSQPVTCDDGDVCTIDRCSPNSGCTHLPEPDCDDGPCCDPDQKPSCFGTINSGGATCCDDGTWACNAADGSDTCPGAVGPVCEDDACCDPGLEPGVGGNPFCFEGSTCCDDGSWRCNAADGSDTCPGSAGPVCDDDGPCCDPDQKPSCFGTINSGGATCCDDGTWACNAADGSDTCPGSAGPVCACDPSAPPGLPNACDGV